jgi:hypothetical protein
MEKRMHDGITEGYLAPPQFAFETLGYLPFWSHDRAWEMEFMHNYICNVKLGKTTMSITSSQLLDCEQETHGMNSSS